MHAEPKAPASERRSVRIDSPLLSALPGCMGSDTPGPECLAPLSGKTAKKEAKKQDEKQDERNFPLDSSKIGDGAVTTSKIGDGAVTAEKIAPGTLGALAYGQVDDNGASLVAARTSGITNVTRSSTGVYCLSVDASIASQVFAANGTPIRPTVASVEWGNTATAEDAVAAPRGANVICGDNLLEIRTERDGSGLVNDVAFTVAIP